MEKISFIIHGKHRHSSALVSDIRKTFRLPYETVFTFTEAPGHAVELAKEAALSGSQYIIAVTGDGTLNETVNGIMQSGNKEVILGLLPSGTGNDFARTMKVTNNLGDLKHLIELRHAKTIDLGLMSYQKEEGTSAERYFINIADVGIGGVIAKKIAVSSKRLGAMLTFQKAILGTFLTFKHQVVKSKADGYSYEGKILSYIIANGKYFGAGLGIAPHAQPDDGILSIVIGADISLWDYLKNLGNIRKCIRINHPQMNYLSAKEVTIEAPSSKLPVDMDGEFIGYTPVRATVVSGALRFLCPQ